MFDQSMDMLTTGGEFTPSSSMYTMLIHTGTTEPGTEIQISHWAEPVNSSKY